jgi:predicted nucleotidyltransferase
VRFGLEEMVWDSLTGILSEPDNVDKIILYGSRAKGVFREGSDIDLALVGEEIEIKQILGSSERVEQLNLPWEVDLCSYGALRNQDLKNHIDRVGVELYRRKDAG